MRTLLFLTVLGPAITSCSENTGAKIDLPANGGFNLQIANSTGRLVGDSAGRMIRSEFFSI